MKNKLCVVFCLLIVVFSVAQESSTLIKLKETLQQEKIADTTKLSLHLKIANSYLTVNIDSSMNYYQQGLELAKQHKSTLFTAKFYDGIGICYETNSNYIKAVEVYNQSIIHYQRKGNRQKIAYLYSKIGDCYSAAYFVDKGLDSYLKGLEIYKSISDKQGIASMYNNIGNLYYEEENFLKAKEYFTSALNIFTELNNKKGIEYSYSFLANAVSDAGDIELGMEYYKKAIEIQEELKDKYGIAINYNNIGDCYLILKDYKKAEEYFRKSLEIAGEINFNKDIFAVGYLNLALINQKQQNFKEAVKYAKLSLNYSQQLNLLDYQADIYEIMSDSYENLGEISIAHYFLKQATKLKDSLAEIDKISKVNLFNSMHKIEDNKQTISDLTFNSEINKKKYETSKTITYFLIGTTVIFLVFIVFLIIQHNSKRKAVIITKHQNTQIKTLNAEIKSQRDYLKQLNNTKDRLFSIIGHDLKNPFNSILGFTDLLIDNNKEYDDEKRLKFLKIIKEATLKSANLLNNLLNWANTQTGNIDFNPEKINLKIELFDVLSLLEIQAINKEIRLQNNMNEDIYVNADSNMVTAILRNLISNAIKFTNPQGLVEINSKVINGFVEITVKDNGVGIPKNEIEKLFKIDEKYSNLGTLNEQGSGLGLILCKEFVEKHGGNINVKSIENEGSEFIFTLPKWEA